MKVLTHPVVLVAGGVVVGLVFASQLRKLPLVSKIPTV